MRSEASEDEKTSQLLPLTQSQAHPSGPGSKVKSRHVNNTTMDYRTNYSEITLDHEREVGVSLGLGY